MPYEHETKFVVALDLPPLKVACMSGILPGLLEDITQAYLDDGMRVRRSVTRVATTFKFTYKRRTRKGVIEIEDDITRDDFQALLEESERCLTKQRTPLFHVPSDYDLEFDVYQDGDGVYLHVIEVEHDELEPDLSMIEALLGEALVLRVPDTDRRFSNYKLADVAYAKALAAEVYGQARDRAAA